MSPAGRVPSTLPAGWYLLECAPPQASPQLWLSGHDIRNDGAPGEVRIPLRADPHGGIRAVVLLARDTHGLGLRDAQGTVPLPFTLNSIGRSEAAHRMFDGLRRPDGRRDWWRSMVAIARMAARAAAGDMTGAGNTLVAAYHGPMRLTQPCALRTGLFTQLVEFDPIEQLLPVVADDGERQWETTGEDPKFRLSRSGAPLPLPAGWYRFDGWIQQREGQVVAPCLYPDYGNAAATGDMIELPAPDSAGRIAALVLIKFPLRELRFDPTVRQARFFATGLRLRRIGRMRALLGMLPVHRGDGGIDWPASADATRDFLRQVRHEGLSIAAAALFHRHERQRKSGNASYEAWVRRYDSVTPAARTMFARRAARLVGRPGDSPTFSILLPVFQTPERWLRRCLDSVLQQAYGEWELCVVDDASTAPHVRRVLEEYAARDARIRVAFRSDNGHIVAASNDALSMARGEYVGLLDHDDELRPHALLEMAEALAADPGLALLYSDEDKIDEHGRRFEPYFKPDWNPDLLLGQNYVCHFSVIRADLVREAGGFRAGFEGSQDHDLILRCARTLSPQQVRHIPKVLYHWRAIPGSTALHRDAKDYAAAAGARAVAEHLRDGGSEARVELLEQGHYRVHWPVPRPPPLVSLIVPTRDRPELLRTCIESLLSRTRYPDFEILVVDNQTTDPEALAYLDDLRRHERVVVLDYDAPFNYSAINNWAAARARGSVLALVNNDIEVISPDWLDEMVGQAMRAGVGAVGAMLYYPDDRIQHAGVILGLGGIANHAYVGEPAGIPGHGGRARVAQAMSAVTGACLVVRKDHYQQVGGLDERLQVAFNDIDFCLRLGEAGYRNVWTPFATLYHHESASRGSDESGEKRERFLREIALMEQRWGRLLERDPAYNPNLTLTGKAFDLADPPRG
jgi:glycosyltransferase involved in cell wall biosynthesis